MAGKPVLLAVDDDAAVARAVERDLRRHYSDRYRVLRAESGAAALDLVDRLKVRDDQVALFLVDQRMPQMSGVEFLERGLETFPDAKRVLLTAYADTEAAIKAINDVKLDHYLMKPWDPPEEQLYPVIDDLLFDWAAQAPFDGVRLVGHRFSRESHQARDFLARNQVPYEFLDVERDEEARRLLDAARADAARLPVLLLADGTVLQEPTNLEMAERIGLSTQALQAFYDLIIVGGGPAGLAAAVYGASEGLETVLIEREAAGGQAGQSSRIENYLGFPSGVTGDELARRARGQARRLGAEILAAQEVASVEVRGSGRNVRLTDGTELGANCLLIATGVSYRMLDAPGVAPLTGRGIYYGAARTEASSCRDQDILVVGGANSAGQAAVFFAPTARQVTILVRGAGLEASMSQYLIKQIEAIPNVVLRSQCTVEEAHGDGQLEAVTVRDRTTGVTERLPATAMFVFIGAAPRTEWLGDLVARDERGFILAGPDLMHDGQRPRGWTPNRDPFLLETSVPGIFVAGDVRHRSIKRIASAVGEGSMAVQFVHQYLSKL